MFFGTFVFFFSDEVKNLIWGGGKDVARVMRGLWLGTMMMGASWDIFIFQCRHT